MNPVTVTHDQMTVTTNTGDEAAVRASMGVPEVVEENANDAGGDQSALRREDGEPGGETAAVSTEQGGSVPEPAEPRKPKPRDNPQARIAQALERQRLAEERAARLEAELAAAKAKPAEAKPEADKSTPSLRAKPKEDEVGTKYATYADFIEDLADWKVEQREASKQKLPDVDALVEHKIQERERQRAEAAKMDAHRARVAAKHEANPDLQDAINDADAQLRDAGLHLSAAAMEAVISSDRSGDLVEWLATHPADYLQLARDTQGLDVVAAPLVRQLLEARVGAVAGPGSAPPASTSRAKPPIKPVGASPVTAATEGSDDESFDAYFRRENAKDKKAGRL